MNTCVTVVGLVVQHLAWSSPVALNEVALTLNGAREWSCHIALSQMHAIGSDSHNIGASFYASFTTEFAGERPLMWGLLTWMT